MPKTQNNRNYKESLLISHETEYLRRRYWLTNAMGQPEIYDRIQMLASNPDNKLDFYTNNHFIISHYPLMVLTGTRYIFGKRVRRLRKMVAFDNSSDGEESQITFSGKFSTLGFLKSEYMHSSITSRNLSSQFSNFSNFIKNPSYDSSVHDAFEGKIQIQMIEEPFIDMERVNDLIIDFDDLDAQETIEKYERLQKKIQYQKGPLISFYNKPVYASLMVSQEPQPYMDQVVSEKKRERIERLEEIKKNIRKNRLASECNKNIDNRLTQSKEYHHHSNRKPSKDKKEDSKETKTKNRQKIRQKANELLNRIKSEQYINHNMRRRSNSKKKQ